jgi:hypothetical protein
MSEPIRNQLTLDGREVAGASFTFGPLKFDSLPPGLSWDEVASLQTGDHIEVTLRFAYNKPGGIVKVDGDNGVETGSLEKVFGFTPFRDGFRVQAVLTKAERDQAWAREHGEPAA